jgi:hypothetical protein
MALHRVKCGSILELAAVENDIAEREALQGCFLTRYDKCLVVVSDGKAMSPWVQFKKFLSPGRRIECGTTPWRVIHDGVPPMRHTAQASAGIG